MNLTNTLFTQQDAPTGELRGVSVDVMRELAARLDVPLELVVYRTPGEVADAAGADAWDVTILAIEQARAQSIAFSPPISEIEATYAVHRDAPLHSAAEVDAPAVRIAAAAKAGYELYLTRTLRHATLVRTESIGASFDLLTARGADAVAALRPMLLDARERMPDARILDGNFMVVNHGLGTPRGRDAAGAAYLDAFVREINAAGFIAQSIARHGVRGLAPLS
jgi:polar amino acid transport system substrate-binding protein